MNTTNPFSDPLSSFIFLIGSLGILLALIWLIRRKPVKPERVEASETAPPSNGQAASAPVLEVEAAAPASKKTSPWWAALSKTRLKFEWGGKKSEIKEIKDALEEACLVSDLGMKNTEELLAKVSWDLVASEPAEARVPKAKEQAALALTEWLGRAESAGDWPRLEGSLPKVIWFVGVNGVGKTTSIAKLASELKARGHSVLLAAGDTFRAAAGEQLEIWAQRLGIECVKGAPGADSSSVLFDAIKSAEAKKIDFVLCDSAGRLHNQSQLMEALGKNKRVMEKALKDAPHETLLVLDAHTGQNMISQARQFHDSVKLTGLILTKLDGSARGGAVVAVAKELGLPIRRLGLGEGAEDFSPFEKGPFVSALLGTESSQ